MSFCEKCAAELRPNAKFCANCGTRVAGSAPSSEVAPSAAGNTNNTLRNALLGVISVLVVVIIVLLASMPRSGRTGGGDGAEIAVEKNEGPSAMAVVPAPTAEECAREMEKLEKWGKENDEESVEIWEKYKYIEPLFDVMFEGKPFDEAKLQDSMTKMFGEGLKAAGGNVKCAPVLAESTIKDMKQAAVEIQMMMEGLEDQEIDENERTPNLAVVPAPTAEECAKEMEKLEKWGRENDEASGKIMEKYKDVDVFFDAIMAGKPFDEAKLKDSLTKMLDEGLIAADGDTRCAAILADGTIIDIKKVTEEMKEMMKGLEDQNMMEDSEAQKTGERNESTTIKIGALFAITGPASPLGTPERDTAVMLTDKLNEAGGINGVKIELIIYDTEAKLDKALQLVKKLIESDQVLAIIGGSTSGIAMTIIPEIEQAGIPYISCSASIRIVDPVNPWVFKTTPSDRLAAEKILDHIKKAYPGVTRLGMINDENPYGVSGLRQLRELAPSMGFELVSMKTFNNANDNARTIGPVLREMVNEGAEVIICWGTFPGPAHVTAAWQDTGIKAEGIPLYQSHGVTNPRFIEFAENISAGSSEGVLLPVGKLMVATELPDSDPAKILLLEYAENFRAKYGREADTFGGYAWDAFNIMVNAIETAGTDRDKIREAIENTKNFVGIGGTFNFSATDHNGLDISAFEMVEIRDRTWKLAR